MEQNPKTVRMWMITCVLFTLVLAAIEIDTDFKMCGTWCHGNISLNLKYDLKTGCNELEISANESTLSIQGSITAKCTQSSSISLKSNPVKNQSNFCMFWKPLLDLLIVEVNGKNHTLCESHGLQENCCTDLSQNKQEPAALYGIVNGSIHGDIISYEVMKKSSFLGDSFNCKKKLCDEAILTSSGANMIEEVVMKSNKMDQQDLPCAQSTIIEMKENFTGLSLTLPASKGKASNKIPSVYLPSCLKSKSRSTSKVVCTYFKDKALFKGAFNSAILDDIVGLSVENEIIKDLPEPVKIRFHHSALPVNYSRRCVSWDTRRDNQENWRYDGCETVKIHDTDLTFITAAGCAMSLVSCLILFYWLGKRSGEKDKSILVHRGLVVATFFFYLCFCLTSILAKTGNEIICKITGTFLYYSLLSTLCWMTVEMFHTFFLIYCVSSSTLPPWVFYLAGFGVPAILVCRLLTIGDIYGLKKMVPSEDVSILYFMCWMLDSDKSRLAHFIIIIGLLAVVVSSGAVMLFFVATKINNQPVWRTNRMACFSIWGLTCLFSITWGLGLCSFFPYSEAILFIFCIVNSCYGFFYMLRYYALERMKKKCERSSDGGSKESVMLQCRDGEGLLYK
ncbi:Adhesion G-protein coupled receptor G1 [Labeo rohita]|uniref:Adhesion G-protein coupled receptor G1 n=1 Tax=Labeo rohita TaxID=84645 RepID=A0ABQ8MIK3_LABRO|nr:Adhesion G-protein coupled receptor G1 [Labeo rohita]